MITYETGRNSSMTERGGGPNRLYEIHVGTEGTTAKTPQGQAKQIAGRLFHELIHVELKRQEHLVSTGAIGTQGSSALYRDYEKYQADVAGRAGWSDAKSAIADLASKAYGSSSRAGEIEKFLMNEAFTKQKQDAQFAPETDMKGHLTRDLTQFLKDTNANMDRAGGSVAGVVDAATPVVQGLGTRAQPQSATQEGDSK